VTPRQVRRLCESRGAAALLSEEELDLYRGFAFENRRRDWLAGRLAAKTLLRRALADGTGPVPAPNEICVRNAPSGAPFLVVESHADLGRGWSISIAHADGHGVCALARAGADGIVGVDLERERPLGPEMLRYFLWPDERCRLERTARSGCAPTPVMLWALKEAVLKAGRDVPCTSLRQVRLRWDEAGAIAVAIEGRRGRVPVVAGYEVRGPWVLAYALCGSAEAR
jgi:phosphopantetheinyl transferase